jgi:hypothetical protein
VPSIRFHSAFPFPLCVHIRWQSAAMAHSGHTGNAGHRSASTWLSHSLFACTLGGSRRRWRTREMRATDPLPPVPLIVRIGQCHLHQEILSFSLRKRKTLGAIFRENEQLYLYGWHGLVTYCKPCAYSRKLLPVRIPFSTLFAHCEWRRRKCAQAAPDARPSSAPLAFDARKLLNGNSLLHAALEEMPLQFQVMFKQSGSWWHLAYILIHVQAPTRLVLNPG